MPSCPTNPTLVLLIASLAINLYLVSQWREQWTTLRAVPRQIAAGQRSEPRRIDAKITLEDRTLQGAASQTRSLLQRKVQNLDHAGESEVESSLRNKMEGKVQQAAMQPRKITTSPPRLQHVERRNGTFYLKPCPKSKLAEKERIHTSGVQARHKYWGYLHKEMSTRVQRPWSASDPAMAPAYIHWSVVPTWTCNTMQRFGVLGDGGKVLCDGSRLLKMSATGQRPLVYSFGSKLECDFEKDVLKAFPTSEIHVFDPTPGVVEGFPSSSCGSVATFHGLGLGGKTKSLFLDGINNYLGRTVPLDNLLSIQKSLGHSQRVVDILKIDIEGSEFETFNFLKANAEASRWPKAKVILLEVHLFDQLFQSNWLTALNAFQKLFSDFEAMGYRVYYKEINPYDARKCVEYALINQKYVT